MLSTLLTCRMYGKGGGAIKARGWMAVWIPLNSLFSLPPPPPLLLQPANLVLLLSRRFHAWSHSFRGDSRFRVKQTSYSIMIWYSNHTF